MIETKPREYHDLALESSNELLECDSRRVLGRYEEAAYHALQAGRCRARMGLLCFNAGENAEAVEDWLSATECFLVAGVHKQAGHVLNSLHRLDAEGKIPAERPDLLAGLRQRDRGLKDLNQKEQQFLRDFALQGHQVDVADQRTLQFLLQEVSGLPGFPLLHYMIFRQASELGQQDLAARHLVWAAVFDPANANLAALLGYLYLASGRPDLATGLGNDFLAAHSSDAGPVRIMLANALASGSEGRPPDQERAIDVLRPLADPSCTVPVSPAPHSIPPVTPEPRYVVPIIGLAPRCALPVTPDPRLNEADADVRERIAALALSAAFHYELGRVRECERLIQKLDQVDESLKVQEMRSIIADFRALIPHPEANGAGEDHLLPRQLLPEKDRLRLFEKAARLSIRAMPLAA